MVVMAMQHGGAQTLGTEASVPVVVVGEQGPAESH